MEYTIHGLHEKLVNKDISSVELTKKDYCPSESCGRGDPCIFVDER